MSKRTRNHALRALLLLAPLLSIRTAWAQAAPTATAPGTFIAVGGTYSVFQSQYGNRTLGGAGLHVDLNLTRAWGLEGEARWLRQNQVADTHETTYLVGPRYQKVLHNGSWRPYAKMLVGDGNFNFPYDYAKGEYFVLAPGAGLEWRATNALSLRLVDFEYQRWPQFTYGTITPYGVSFGITYRIFGGGDWESGARHPPFKRD